MPALAAITLNDSVPTANTFNPVGKNGITSELATADSIYDAKKQLTISIARISASNSVNRFKARITLPIMDAVDTTKRIAFLQGDVTFNLPKEATATNRADLRALMVSLLSHASVVSMIGNVEDMY